MNELIVPYWNQIQNPMYKDARLILLTVGKPFVYQIGLEVFFMHDISVYVHAPWKVNFEGDILDVDASFSIGEYNLGRRNVFGCSFRNGIYVRGFDFCNRRFLSLDKARKEAFAYLGISFQDFLKLFYLPGMTETCRQGIREFLE